MADETIEKPFQIGDRKQKIKQKNKVRECSFPGCGAHLRSSNQTGKCGVHDQKGELGPFYKDLVR